MPEAAAWVVVPAAGRNEAVSGARRLRDAVADGLPGIAVFALVDADRKTAGDPEWTISWPVAMVENLLLDPGALWEVLEPHRERVGLADAAGADSALRDIARNLRGDEIRLRVREALGAIHLAVEPTDLESAQSVETLLTAALTDEMNRLGLPQSAIDAVQRAVQQVDAVLGDGRELESFRGKEILRQTFTQFGQPAGFSYAAFTYALAARARQHSRLRDLVSVPVRKIQRYVPSSIVDAARSAEDQLPTDETKQLAVEVRVAAEAGHDAWLAAAETGPDLSALREGAVQLARVARDHGLDDLHKALVAAAVEIGLGN